MLWVITQKCVHNVDQHQYDDRFVLFTMQFSSIAEALFSKGTAGCGENCYAPSITNFVLFVRVKNLFRQKSV